MDSQLGWITEALESAGIGYWVDSGTLLGLMRDGDLLPHDRDIDIGLWVHDVDKLAILVRTISTENYRILVRRYCGRVYKLMLVPRSQQLRKIDISIYEVARGYAWSPAPIPRDITGRQQVLAAITQQWWAPWRNTRLLLHALVRRLEVFLPGFDITYYPWTAIYKVWTWWIPMKLFEERVFNDELLVWIPYCPDEYLTYRYGDWQIPVKDWVYFRDDKALVHDKPESVIRNYRHDASLSEGTEHEKMST